MARMWEYRNVFNVTGSNITVWEKKSEFLHQSFYCSIKKTIMPVLRQILEETTLAITLLNFLIFWEHLGKSHYKIKKHFLLKSWWVYDSVFVLHVMPVEHHRSARTKTNWWRHFWHMPVWHKIQVAQQLSVHQFRKPSRSGELFPCLAQMGKSKVSHQ